MKIFRWLSLLLCFILAGCDSGGSSSSGGGGSKAVTKVVALGDSITRGFGVPESYVGPLSRSIGKPVVNAGSDGRTTGGGVGLVGSLIAQHNPSHLIILLGTNDAIRGLSPDAARANMQAMIDQANARNVKAVFGTLPPIPRSAAETERARAISAAYGSLKGAARVNLQGEFGSGKGLFTDGVHPNTNGQNIIAAAFADKL